MRPLYYPVQLIVHEIMLYIQDESYSKPRWNESEESLYCFSKNVLAGLLTCSILGRPSRFKKQWQ